MQQSIDGQRKEAGLEENPEALADIARKTGATEQEALALYLLERLGEVFDELPNVITGEKVQFAVHHQALVNMLAVRVVAREHPEAWGRADNPEDRGQDAHLGPPLGREGYT